jgi:hypothetical protein
MIYLFKDIASLKIRFLKIVRSVNRRTFHCLIQGCEMSREKSGEGDIVRSVNRSVAKVAAAEEPGGAGWAG